jgi:hypothetical protein
VQYADEQFTDSKNFVSGRVKRLNKVYEQINALDDVTPHALAKKVTLYAVAQNIIGDLYAQAVYDAGLAYNNRKEAQAASELGYIGGTVKERECYGIVAVSDLKKLETKAEAERQRWEKAFYSTENLANAIKHELKVTFFDYGQGGKPS